MKVIVEQIEADKIEVTISDNRENDIAYWKVTDVKRSPIGTCFTITPGLVSPEQQRIQELEERIAFLEQELEAVQRVDSIVSRAKQLGMDTNWE